MSYGNVPNAPGLGGSIVDPNTAKFNNMPFVDNDAGKPGLQTARDMHAPNADKSTIASKDPSTKLPQALQGSNSQVLSNMMPMLSQVQSMMMLNLTNNSSDSDSNSNSDNMQQLVGVSNLLQKCLTNVFCHIINDTSFTIFLNVLINCFGAEYQSGNYYNIAPKYKAIISQSVLDIIKLYIQDSIKPDLMVYPTNCLSNTQSNSFIQIGNNVSSYSKTNINTNTSIYVSAPYPIVPPPPPNGFIQQYYVYNNDPYFGYIQWKGPNGNVVYTVRTANQPNYDSVDVALQKQAEVYIYDFMYPRFINQFITAGNINYVLTQANEILQSNAYNAISGQNDDSSDSFIDILGSIGSMITTANSNHLPSSVLDQQSMSNTLTSFTNNIGVLQQMKNISNTAFSNSSGNLNSLSSLSNNFQYTNTGTFSQDTVSYLQGNGLSNDDISYLSNLYSNTNSTTNTVSAVASLTIQLEKNKIDKNKIKQIQQLLVEVLNI